MINVTKTWIPPMDEYIRYLKVIWETNQLTNNGPLVCELEERLRDYLGVKHLFFVSNGTIALQIAIKVLKLHGEVITTPFSYVATTSTIVWEGCRPIFVDIHPETLCLDPDLIEVAITPETTAILATHVYGNPCNVERIQEIVNIHGLKVVYDAAHAFGVRYKDSSILTHGDISALSFHATKLFHTAEGGAITTNNDELAHRISYMRNFGHRGREAFWGLGINGKNSEFHAAMGLCVLPKVPELIARRKAISEMYDELLCDIGLISPNRQKETIYNYAYYPILFPSEKHLISALAALNEQEIFPRRYFYPSLNMIDYTGRRTMSVSESAARRVLCLPLYDSIDPSSVELISAIINSTMWN